MGLGRGIGWEGKRHGQMRCDGSGLSWVGAEWGGDRSGVRDERGACGELSVVVVCCVLRLWSGNQLLTPPPCPTLPCLAVRCSLPPSCDCYVITM